MWQGGISADPLNSGSVVNSAKLDQCRSFVSKNKRKKEKESKVSKSEKTNRELDKSTVEFFRRPKSMFTWSVCRE
jgi:hypothetical protein